MSDKEVFIATKPQIMEELALKIWGIVEEYRRKNSYAGAITIAVPFEYERFIVEKIMPTMNPIEDDIYFHFSPLISLKLDRGQLRVIEPDLP